ncbi:hypothetical protein SPI_07973 [Niveomyces insectorum RCEF 264]|uniref:Alternative oxidase n=1 Tax=Niveomyces insectorum RCEF 264 TaxID=1081102 RepID=A0A167P739_9HYPO|nr:hypothetical protein SPI_07973 [Niveomyces insectorum RCEF 264]
MMNRRFGLPAALLIVLVFVWSVRLLPWNNYAPNYPADAWNAAKQTFGGSGSSSDSSSSNSNGASDSPSSPASSSAPLAPANNPPAGAADAAAAGGIDASHVQMFFDQTFANEPTTTFPYTELRAACAAADWDTDEAYLNCVGIEAGLTSIVSQVKVCFKMAVDTGSHLVLPRMPLRDSHNLREFNFLNGDAYLPYDQWFDAAHVRAQLADVCPRMRILDPEVLSDDRNPNHNASAPVSAGSADQPKIAVRRRLSISCGDAPFYQKIHSYFWVGRPFKTFFFDQFHKKQEAADAAEAEAAAAAANATDSDSDSAAVVPRAASNPDGITVVDIDSEFLLFRITDDPTRRDLRLWTELAHLVRFRADVRAVVATVLARLPPAANYFGVHFRAENDSIWSPAEHQLAVDLDALDRAWTQFGNAGETDAGAAAADKPPVYLACGDPEQIKQFEAAAAARGWTTTDKWKLAAAGGSDTETTDAINRLAFDFQGAIDLGVMLRSRFFIGVQGSAFSSTVGNHRDVTGRYRGSSFEMPDEGARTHLFNDLDATEYACCL